MRLAVRLACLIVVCASGLAAGQAAEPLPLPPPQSKVIPPAAPAAPPLVPPADMELPGNLAIDNRETPLTLGEVL